MNAELYQFRIHNIKFKIKKMKYCNPQNVTKCPHICKCKILCQSPCLGQGSRNIRKSAKVVTMSLEGVPPVTSFWGYGGGQTIFCR